MSGPLDQSPPPPSRPARGRLGRAAVAPPQPASAERAEVLEGQTAAVLGALARMQLRLDVLAREQSDMFARLLTRLDQLEEALHEQEPSGEANALSTPLTDDLATPLDPAPLGGEPRRSWQDSGS